MEDVTTLDRYVLTAHDRFMRVFDAADPRNPALVASYLAQGTPEGVSAQDGFVYLASRDGGVEVLAIRPPGDLDGDDDVDLADLQSLLAAFGTCESGQGFNLYADLDIDGCVSLTDLALLIAALD
jgi:hypothetical protein